MLRPYPQPYEYAFEIEILNAEARLGFLWPRGMSRRSYNALPEVVIALLESIEDLKQDFAHLSIKELRGSLVFANCVDEAFDRHGPGLWPTENVDTRGWLVNPDENDWDGLYPQRLYYGDPDLREKFHDLIREKVDTFGRNQIAKAKADHANAEYESDHEKHLPAGNREDSMSNMKSPAWQRGPSHPDMESISYPQQFVPIPPMGVLAVQSPTRGVNNTLMNAIIIEDDEPGNVTTGSIDNRFATTTQPSLAQQILQGVQQKIQSPSWSEDLSTRPSTGQKHPRSSDIGDESVVVKP